MCIRDRFFQCPKNRFHFENSWLFLTSWPTFKNPDFFWLPDLVDTLFDHRFLRNYTDNREFWELPAPYYDTWYDTMNTTKKERSRMHENKLKKWTNHHKTMKCGHVFIYTSTSRKLIYHCTLLCAEYLISCLLFCFLPSRSLSLVIAIYY